ncbi:type VII secretion protein EccB [Amycolatopsis granulosa]|uniref:type VII secretion protein EccB n=1 Tax=Amycolatopsis granulosa TaxID=185684 RepID=UPI001422249A|nr:type VII secretion protein EccB [Amycolatopsis granulosa]NIH85643.1 type VII secretion protein EccB [Amycolatopsis granulosa]
MPSTPTTKSQVHAYQFVLRRMQSALVRRDSVMLHDPMRTHGRATIVGFLVALLGIVGFAIFGLISPKPAVPGSGNIVIGEESGAIYVVTGNPKQLVPTFNLASARLLLMAQQGQNGGAATAAVQPSVVPDDQLKDIPRGRLTGIVDGPQLLPTTSQRVSDDWAVCDRLTIRSDLPSQLALQQATNATTVLAGVPNPGRELGGNEAVLAVGDNGKPYLIYRLERNPNQPNANTVRAELDPSRAGVYTALGLNPQNARRISIGLLNAIPQVTPFTPPAIPGKGSASQFQPLGTAGLAVGDVFVVSFSDGTRSSYVVLQNGIQRVSPAVADLIRFSGSSAAAPRPQELPPNTITAIRQIQSGDADALKVDTMPNTIPTVLDPTQTPVTCLGWNVVNPGDPTTEDQHTAVYMGTQLPVPADAKLIQIGQPSPDGLKIDNFYLPPGRGAVVRSATSKQSFATGPISLVTDRGLRYGVPDANTANALGLTDPRPAPDAIVRLLPTGASLNVQDAQRSYDSVPVSPDAGSFPSRQQRAAGN